ncbi:putative signal transducing protein [Seonamhaeicola marinus]|uniref:DUF2007 domain-containing protein n=1 Tax=Seonamhaeicola marinus TaxID=1912246 RepID=A0A5D0IAE7_9FLAO|nr:DUF2007 domain-containing protein [Seonamhaeicola marinus]TYA78752.1 DUF2007 domain-containing protein [Seonamhaeicola marinus]
MTDSNYIKVFTGDFIIVKRVLNELENVNIRAVIKDETEAGRLAGFGAAVQGLQEVYVHKDELDKTLQIIESLNSELQA